MNIEVPLGKAECEPLNLRRIENRLKGCAALPSLGSIDTALKELLSADQRYTSQIAEIIRRTLAELVAAESGDIRVIVRARGGDQLLARGGEFREALEVGDAPTSALDL